MCIFCRFRNYLKNYSYHSWDSYKNLRQVYHIYFIEFALKIAMSSLLRKEIFFLIENFIFDSKSQFRPKFYSSQNFNLNTKCNFRSEILFSTRKDSEIWLRDFSIGKILKFNCKTPVQVSNSGSKSKVRLNNARYVWGG